MQFLQPLCEECIYAAVQKNKRNELTNCLPFTPNVAAYHSEIRRNACGIPQKIGPVQKIPNELQ